MNIWADMELCAIVTDVEAWEVEDLDFKPMEICCVDPEIDDPEDDENAFVQFDSDLKDGRSIELKLPYHWLTAEAKAALGIALDDN